jgi:hypothetical protein
MKGAKVALVLLIAGPFILAAGSFILATEAYNTAHRVVRRLRKKSSETADDIS